MWNDCAVLISAFASRFFLKTTIWNEISDDQNLKCYRNSILSASKLTNVHKRFITGGTLTALETYMYFQLINVMSYRPHRSCGKVMFLHLSVILSTRVCVSQHALEQTPPPGQTSLPPGRHPPGKTPLPPSRRLLQRTVCILLECIVAHTVVACGCDWKLLTMSLRCIISVMRSPDRICFFFIHGHVINSVKN